MDSIDISDLAFSLSNFSPVNEILSNTPDIVSDIIPDIVPDIVSDIVSELVSEPIISKDIIPDISHTNIDNNFFLYLGIGLIIISIIGIFTYNYFLNKTKRVTFQDNAESSYIQPPPNYPQSDF